MLKSYLKKYIVILFALLAPMFAHAAVPTWQIVPAESSLTFTATQNGAPVTGKFKKFTGEINFDPDQLSASNVNIVVDVGSIADPYNQLADTLKSADWFDTKRFPQVVFTAHEFTKMSDKTYQAKGTLSIRDKTLPVILNFTQEEYSSTKARVSGKTTIKRTAFGVGQGEWADTNAVKDDVRVDFVLTAIKK
jgi:polyisoprenoid-binding protein YceI